ncbi:transcriptional regulator [uncultured Amnibacterium sp.]|uniref:transcriptional regulator n=1 Tax=uncultured Amnibacterium sp. TaxID=1631851 RepID=UPI0035CA8121
MVRRRLVAESWARAEAVSLAPDRVEVVTAIGSRELAELQRTHPLAGALPVIRSLLLEEAEDDTGLVVTVADAAGRLLWVDGDPRTRRLAEALRVVPGADWAESRVGTNAPGTALALDRTMQVAGEEHFALQVQRLSCSAVPIHDLGTGEVIGALDISGGAAAVGPRSLPLLAATVAAAERELLLQRLLRAAERPAEPVADLPPRLDALGRDRAELHAGGRVVPLSLRHAELLTLLSWHRGGLTAERLAELVHGRRDATATIRPEMTRLRRLLEASAPSLVPLTRPYRLPAPLELDARRLISLLDRGAHRAALEAYRGELLPSSVAPGIEEIRAEVDGHLRESLLETASPDLLLAYAARVAPGDPAPLLTALQILPARSPRRAGIVARLRALA